MSNPFSTSNDYPWKEAGGMGEFLAVQWEKTKFQLKTVGLLGWLFVILGFIIPFVSENDPVAKGVFAQVFCGIHLVTVILLSYYFGFKGAILVVALGTIHHIQADVQYFDSPFKGIIIALLRAVFALSVGYVIGKVKVNEYKLGQLNEELNACNNLLAKQSTTDWLTGLCNSRVFYEKLEKELEKAAVNDTPLSLLMLDLDDFKNYNDTLGHLQGDNLLKELGKLLRDKSRSGDIVCRYGGEEFTIILPGTGPDEARGIAELIRQSISEHSFEGREVQKLGQITVSIGVAAYPNHAKNLREMLGKADQMLYQVKKGSKNRVMLYGEV